MTGETSVPEEVTVEDSEQDLKSQTDHHIGRLPGLTRAVYRVMSVLATASLLVPVGFLAWAVYLSINWRENDGFRIAVWWLAFAASIGLPAILGGLTTVIARADPLLVFPGQKGKLVTGRRAVWQGVQLIMGGLLMSAFWGLWAYTISLRDVEKMEPFLEIFAAVIGVGVTAAVALSLFQKFTRSR